MSAPTTLPPPYRPDDPALRRAAVALFLAGVAVFALLYAPQPLLPDLSAEFGVSPTAATLSVSLTTLTLALGLVAAGPLSERVGRTRLVHASLAAATVLGLLCAVAPTWELLLAGRALLGVALAGLPAVAVAYLHEELPGEAVGRAVGLYVGGNAIGGMAGRLLAGGLDDLGGWRLATAGTGLLSLACALAVALLLPASRRFVPGRRGLRAVGRAARGVLTDPVLLGLYAVGALLMGAFVAVFNALGFRLQAPPYVLSTASAGLVFLVYPLGSVASTLAGRAADRRGRRAVVPVGVALMLAGVALTAVRPLAGIVAGLAVLTVGFFTAHGVASGWVAARAGLGGRATAQATSTYLVAYYAGSSVGGSLAGRAWSAGGWSGVVLLCGGLVLAAGVLSLLLRRSVSLLAGGNPPVGS